MATEEEIKTLIEDFAFDLSQALPDPAGWGIWLVYLLEALEKEAADRYDLTLELLRQAVEERIGGISED